MQAQLAGNFLRRFTTLLPQRNGFAFEIGIELPSFVLG
jgi:hypothetical protein